jgi:CheY-like chemotaxis protein
VTSPSPSSPGDPSASVPPEIAAYVKRELSEVKREILSAFGSLFGGGKLPDVSGTAAAADGGKYALVCESDNASAAQITQTLKNLGYIVHVAGTLAESIKRLENQYAVITIDSEFPDDKDGGQKILARINGQKPRQRRENFVVLLSAGAKSADATTAFLQGANIVVNKAEIQRLEQLIHDGIRHFQQFYSNFNRILAEKEA